ncbi:manganese efflux pump MntP family protein [Terrisporobacter mayombei]|uniref:Sporulation protein YtaF n=1 Tax=Terrisporobacter mayombei TaxID=1541 RepID=A0ABY9Q079_9FIRM|nr:manganese efflux pump [Terrisporobacter mayombei]MCC3868269.1 manganese efflux pump [Terrisporobacter mayombei]WMT80410.1 putative sporulation protein YtaF [Terrisporobacter mayombei]
MNLITAILLSISANLDTFTVATSYGIKKIRLSFLPLFLITTITTAGTFISMCFGASITNYISADMAALVGSLMLVGIGIYMIVDYYKNTKIEGCDCICNESNCKPLETMLENENKSNELTLKESITLSLALTINNLGIGVAASIAGISIYLNTICTFIITILSLILGLAIGNSYLSKIFGKYAGLASGIIILILGLYECFL